MWIKVEVGNHYGIFEIMGVELYKEEEDSYIIYGYLTNPIPHIPVGIQRGLKDEMTHWDFVKIYEFDNEEDARREIDRMQVFLDENLTGVYAVQAGGEAKAA